MKVYQNPCQMTINSSKIFFFFLFKLLLKALILSYKANYLHNWKINYKIQHNMLKINNLLLYLLLLLLATPLLSSKFGFTGVIVASDTHF